MKNKLLAIVLGLLITTLLIVGYNTVNVIAVELLIQRVSNEMNEVKNTVILHNPTFMEMHYFTINDTISEKSYINGTYMCGNFAMDTVKRALQRGISCAYVEIMYTDGTGHAITAYNCTDIGLILIEPQDDRIVNLHSGDVYLTGTISKIIYIW
jgi:hypothetical protein